MRFPLAASIFVVASATCFGQAPAPATASSTSVTAAPQTAVREAEGTPAQSAQVQRDDIGFSYSLPADWQIVAASPAPKVVLPYPAAVAPKKGDACIDVAMTARHGESASVMVVLALPFDCYGQTLTASDLENFGIGAAAGLKQSFAIMSQAQGNYSLGTHPVWIERADGTPKGHPENPYTFEIACTVLEKGAACWTAMAADAASLRDFEQQAVTLEGDRFGALVPAGEAPAVPEGPLKRGS
ncbi:exported hypothetical protein [Candidatus Sulfotelmatomonas gaucii]|uniref:Lipoprotein n=1 Tax=Candidatus Sulfuritelmatomonas gaucii TaxID=2043161 RepID=A0A2N9M552_9BACT|nr:exported hypothetical protein [Candidatus Sulfotelmatomonas gaucii]